MCPFKKVIACLCIFNFGLVFADGEAPPLSHESCEETDDIIDDCSPLDLENGEMLIGSIVEITEALKVFRKNHPRQRPQLKCDSCKMRKLAYREFSGFIIGRMLMTGVNGVLNADIKSVCDGFVKVLSEGTSEQVADFMLTSMPIIKYDCGACEKIDWKKVVRRVKSYPIS